MIDPTTAQTKSGETAKKTIKCVVWDLDHTLWHGTLLEDDHITLRQGVVDIIKTLDTRGILQSIASKNDAESVMTQLQEYGLDAYFLYPQINWNSKVRSIESIATSINIGLDTIAFIDDQAFERDEVRFSLPQVLCLDPTDLDGLLDRPEMNPPFLTADAKVRRLMYMSDMQRKKEEEEFTGTKEEFLASLNMVFTIAPAHEEELRRAEELTVRTHQLNTTGYTYSYEELKSFLKSDRHKLLIAGLHDKYGDYGKIGLALVECSYDSWTIKLLLMSCRVMTRGVGTILMNYILQQAKIQQVRVYAEFVPTERNRMMYITYKFAGFSELEKRGDLIILENTIGNLQPFPDYIEIQTEA